MKDSIPFITNFLSGVIGSFGSGGVNAARSIHHDAIFIRESQVSPQPKVMAAASVVLILAIILLSRK